MDTLKQLWLTHGEALTKRLKSFAWRASCVAAISGLSWASENLGLLELSQPVQVLLGLGLAECTKWIRNNTALFGARLK